MGTRASGVEGVMKVNYDLIAISGLDSLFENLAAMLLLNCSTPFEFLRLAIPGHFFPLISLI